MTPISQQIDIRWDICQSRQQNRLVKSSDVRSLDYHQPSRPKSSYGTRASPYFQNWHRERVAPRTVISEEKYELVDWLGSKGPPMPLVPFQVASPTRPGTVP